MELRTSQSKWIPTEPLTIHTSMNGGTRKMHENKEGLSSSETLQQIRKNILIRVSTMTAPLKNQPTLSRTKSTKSARNTESNRRRRSDRRRKPAKNKSNSLLNHAVRI